VRNGGITLAGSLWMPSGRPVATVLMHPGSGPSDRDNDVYFPPIRRYLLDAGVAVASFDKRGVGGSTGRWEEAAIEEQAGDALACAKTLASESGLNAPVGLFGHSQGGWVVIEATSRSAEVAFVVSSAGPGVTPAEQERYATRAYMEKADIPHTEVDEVGRYYDHLLSMMRSGVPFDDVRDRIAAEGFPSAFETLGLPALPENEAEWKLFAALIDYDPRPALERIGVPVLALFGAEDPITPVEASVAVFREAVRPELLTVAVFPGANHRVETGDPSAMADGYLETLAGFVVGAVA
jgi:uncharacterized protein